ncbi:LysR family transcriptional regulator [Tateyamaria sp. ANG-S1]|uniref:LysR family transcriptional regulator n=1 Tax=Tateyamaria sp. ANG-S1 TaxID=1577905 RepID=UPI00057D53BF|nr:LysR family transcriptional regulator [Tateyamaria sp. ANG-S1]KIC51810.1 hypothetical protein RA29_00415 [Tateyamaria sp. ANG-S1]
MKRAPIHGIEVFLAIVREGSLRAAATSLGIGAPAVSLQLKALEDRMGVGLLHRSTRRIELTDAGRVLFENAEPAYRDLLEAAARTQEAGAAPHGTLKLSVSRGAYIAALEPHMAGFLAEHPGINLDISFDERLVDVIGEGVHAGIRQGDILAPDMIAVRLTPPLTPAYFAAPSYLKVHGRPETLRDLLTHQCIRYRFPTTGRLDYWHIIEEGRETRIDPPARLVFDQVDGVIRAAQGGHGIGWALRSSIQDQIDSGALETVLDEHVRDLPPYYLYYPENNKRIACLRQFIAFLMSARSV